MKAAILCFSEWFERRLIVVPVVVRALILSSISLTGIAAYTIISNIN
jgi:hypothetical protein